LQVHRDVDLLGAAADGGGEGPAAGRERECGGMVADHRPRRRWPELPRQLRAGSHPLPSFEVHHSGWYQREPDQQLRSLVQRGRCQAPKRGSSSGTTVCLALSTGDLRWCWGLHSGSNAIFGWTTPTASTRAALNVGIRLMGQPVAGRGPSRLCWLQDPRGQRHQRCNLHVRAWMSSEDMLAALGISRPSMMCLCPFPFSLSSSNITACKLNKSRLNVVCFARKGPP